MGSLIYHVYQNDSMVGNLNIEFFAGFKTAYNKLRISLKAKSGSFDKGIVEKLTKKFHSFAEEKK